MHKENYVLWKESLNRDGQRFNHYQQNDQLPLTSTHQIRTMTYGAGNRDPGLGQVLKCGDVKPVNEI